MDDLHCSRPQNPQGEREKETSAPMMHQQKAVARNRQAPCMEGEKTVESALATGVQVAVV